MNGRPESQGEGKGGRTRGKERRRERGRGAGAREPKDLWRPKTRVLSAGQRREEGLQVGRGAGCSPRRPCGEGQQTAARRALRGSDCRVHRGPGREAPRAQGLGRPRSAGLGRLFLLLRTAARGACAGLAWAPGPQPLRAIRWGLRGPWGPRSWALAGGQPPPHAAPGTGAPRRPRKPSAGEGGVPASDESAPAPAPAPATASCPPGRKGGNPSSITATDPSEASPPVPPPHGPRTPGERPDV